MIVDWLTLNPDYGGTGDTTVIATAAYNYTVGLTRFATVRFTNAVGMTDTVTITQGGNTEGLMFEVSPESLEFPITGATLTGSVISNSQWLITDYPEWVTITTDSQEAYGEGILSITVSAYTGATERTGTITIQSYGETRTIEVSQPGYTTLSVSPQKIQFRGSVGSSSITVTSSVDWSTADYDRDHIELSADSGQSGTTTVTLRLKDLPRYVTKYGVGFEREVTFNDGFTQRTVVVQYIGSQNIDDKYITVTYNIPTPGTYLVYKYVRCSGCTDWGAVTDSQTIWAKTEIHKEELVPDDWEGWPCYEMVYVFYYFGTAGRHTVKYYSDYYGIGMGAFSKVQNIDSIVIGDRNNGTINPWAISKTNTRIVFGAGTHTFTRNASNPYSLNEVNTGNYLYVPPTVVYGTSGARNVWASQTLVYDNSNDYGVGMFAKNIVFTERFDSGCSVNSLNANYIEKLVFLSPTAPKCNTAPSHPVTVYYPRGGTGYSDRWASRPNITLVPYDDIDDVPV